MCLIRAIDKKSDEKCRTPDRKVCFLRAENIFPSQICPLGWENHPCIASPYEVACSQVYFPNSAHFIGRCAYDSLFARGRSSARFTYFPVCVEQIENK